MTEYYYPKVNLKGKKIGLFPNHGTYHCLIFVEILKKMGLEAVPYENIIRHDKTIFHRVYYNLFSLFILLIMPFLNLRKDLKYKGYNIGHSLIEICVRLNKLGEFRIFSRVTFDKIKTSIRFIDNIQYLKNIEYVIGGDEAYPFGSIVGQFARRKNINYLFLKGHLGNVVGFKFTKNSLFAGPDFKTFKSLYESLKFNNEILTEKRFFRDVLQGKRDYSYMRKNMDNDFLDEHVFNNSIVLFLHDFIDSIGLFGDNLFYDQWAWLDLTINTTSKFNQNLIIKIHPNISESNFPAIDYLKKKYKKNKFVNFYSKPIRTRDLKEVNVKGILTLFGSVILEAAFFNIPCISSGINPYIAFDLSTHVSSKREYKKMLSQLCNNTLPLKHYDMDDVFAAFSIKQYEMAKPLIIENMPFSDMNIELFGELFGSEYKDWESFGKGERRAVFISHVLTKKYIINALEKNIDRIVINIQKLT